MVENIQKIQKDRLENLSTLKQERKMIEKEIKKTRMKINAQLDIVQEALINDLYTTESKERKIIRKLLDSIEQRGGGGELRIYQENIISIKQNASDLQIFMTMKQMERDIAEKEEYFTSLVKSNKLKGISLSFKMNDALKNGFNEVRRFGEIIIMTHPSELAIVRKKEKQAQIVVAHAQSKSIDHLSFILEATINTNLDDVRGCSLLPYGRMAFSCYKQNRIRVFKRDCFQDFDVSLHPTRTFDITYIHNNDIAVTSGVGGNQCINIIDVDRKNVKETIPVKSYCAGIVRKNNTLIYCSESVLHMINLSDKSERNIVTSEIPMRVASFGDKLYFTNWNTNTVVCCDLHGTTQWKFKDVNVLTYPKGISVDKAGNVYVVGNKSQNVVVISPDGQRHRQLLSVNDGLDVPTVIHYNCTTNQLLVANKQEKAFIFKLK